MSASTGMLGGARAQYNLRQTFVILDMKPVNKPEIMVNFAAQKFDEKGNLTDDKTKELISTLLTALVTWTRRLQASA
jgi:chromate reductase